MSFISEELANVLKSVYMKEESGKVEDVNSSIKLDKDDVDIPKVEKRSRKHKHKKRSSKSKSRDKKKHKKRKRKSRSRSSSESRSRSRSRSTEQENSKPHKSRPLSSRSKSPDEIDQSDFVLQKERADEDDKDLSSDKERNNLKSKEAFETVSSSADLGFKEKCKEIAVSESKTLEDENEGGNAESVDDKTLNLHNLSPASKKEKERSASRGKSEEKVTQSKQKNSPSHSRGKSRSPDDKSSQTLKQRQSRSHSRDQHIAKKLRSCSKESVHRKTSRSRSSSRNKKKAKSHSRSSSRSKSRSRSPSRNKSAKRRKSKSRSHSTGKNQNRSGSRSRSRSHSHSKSRKSRSRSKQRSTKQKRTKSRSHSKERNRKRSLPKSRSHSHSHSKSKSRSRSPRHKRTRSRSRRRSPVFRNFRRFSPPHWRRGSGSFRQRSQSTSRSRRSSSRRRSYSRRRDSRSRSDSRSKSRQKNGRRSRSRSRVRRSRSRSQVRNRKSRSVSKGKRRRSRSLSHSKGKGRRSTSRDRNRNRTRSRSKSKSKDQTQTVGVLPNPKTNTATANNVSSVTDKPVATTLSSQQVKVAQKAGGKTIAELTAFCKKLQEEKEDSENVKSEDGSKVDEEQTQTVTHHPFLVKEKPDITIPPVIFPVNMNKPSLPAVDPSKPLQEQFPVSCGSKHREKEHVNDGAGIVADVDGSANQQQQINEVFAPPITEKLDISELVGKRMEAQRRLQSDPNDIEALLTLQEIQMKMQNWCQSNVKPGQFTGELVKNLLPKEDLQGGFQAWAKKDMFHNLTPVSGGIGMKLLQKMGWKPGQVIGKRGEGYAEPIALTVKIDRKGLSAGKEKAAKKSTPAVLDLQGKHPVSALAEYCSKRKWQLPDYSLIFDHGPAHHKQFLFKVLVNGTEYQPAVVCGNKKQAKAQAAIFALKGLGLIPEDADMSAV